MGSSVSNKFSNKNCNYGLKYLKTLYSNARSIVNKMAELEILVQDCEPDIIGISETWAHDSINDAELALEGYRIYREDRLDTHNGRGGGVILYVAEYLSSKIRDDLGEVKKGISVWCDIYQGSNMADYLTVGVVYRSPNGDLDENDLVCKLVEKAASGHVVIMGDFNYPDIEWDFLTAGNVGKNFLDQVQDSFLFQHVDFPTRGNNILDLVLSSEEGMVSNLTTIGKLGASDHDILFFNLCTKVNIKHNQRLVPNFRRANWQQINQDMAQIDWDVVLEGKDVEESWSVFKSKLLHICGKHVPYCKKRQRRRKPWINQGLIRKIRKKRKLYNRYKETGIAVHKEEFVNLQSEVKRDIDSAKQDFELNLANGLGKDNGNGDKCFFAYVRSKQKTKDTIGPLANEQGENVISDKGMANILNTYFCSVFTRENSPQNLELEQFVGNHMGNVKITQDIVLEKIKKVKIGKAPGPDGIYPIVLNKLQEGIVNPLTLIFQKSLDESKTPVDWRMANVAPIFKKGKRNDPANYRPVSLTSVIGKLLESILRDNILEHLKGSDLIGKTQHGFLEKRSCLTNLLEFFEDVVSMNEECKATDVIFLDFAKAFDKVPHRKLVAKLDKYGINEKVINWFRDWLNNRIQRVTINGETSDWEAVLSGVSQGSVLGPLLFVIFIDDIDVGIVSNILKFADDTKIYGKVRNPDGVENLQKDLDKLWSWSEKWQMSFNVDKCKVMHIGYYNEKAKYMMNGSELKVVTSESDLGYIMDENLKPSKHCVEAVKKANKILGMIKRNFVSLNKTIVTKLYKQLVRPRLEYVVQAWNPILVKDIVLLEGVQRRATKLVKHCRNLEYRDRLKYLGLTTLVTRRVRGDMIQTFKIIKGFDDLNPQIFFQMGQNNTRGHQYKIFKGRFISEVGRNVFSNRVVNNWNGLPDSVVESDSVNQFKNRINKHLLEGANHEFFHDFNLL